MACPKISFNTIANVLASVSAVGLAGILGAGAYVYVNKDAIIDNIKKEAIESITGGMGGALTGDIGLPSPQASAPTAPAGPSMGLPVPSSAF